MGVNYLSNILILGSTGMLGKMVSLVFSEYSDDNLFFTSRSKNKFNNELINFAKKLEETCIKTVESGEMTKDLAILINKDQRWLNTQEFLSAIKNNFKIN